MQFCPFLRQLEKDLRIITQKTLIFDSLVTWQIVGSDWAAATNHTVP